MGAKPALRQGQDQPLAPGLVSIILPNRNHGHYIHTAIESFLRQTRPQLELVVIDDASADSSREVVRRYIERDSRVRLIELREHHGINRAVEVGLGDLRGEYLHVAGADDFVEPTFLESCVAQLEFHPQAALCFSDPSEFYRDTGSAVPFPLYLSDGPAYFPPEALVRQFTRNFFYISANTAVYRTSLFREAGGYRADLEWFSDWFVTLVAALRHGACYVPAQLTCVTIRDDSYSATGVRNARDQRRLLMNVMDLLGSTAYADVLPAMREAALLPEYHLRTVLWLMSCSGGRRFITPRLLKRVVARYAWSFLRPFSPVNLRRALRRFSSVRSR